LDFNKEIFIPRMHGANIKKKNMATENGLYNSIRGIHNGYYVKKITRKL